MQLLEEVKLLKSSKKELRNFGITMGIVFVVITVFLLYRERGNYIYSLAVAMLFFVGGFALKQVLKPIYYIWMTFAIVLGWIMTRVILFIIFYFAVTPISVLARLFRKKFMDLGPSSETNTYWRKRTPSVFEKKNYERQF